MYLIPFIDIVFFFIVYCHSIVVCMCPLFDIFPPMLIGDRISLRIWIGMKISLRYFIQYCSPDQSWSEFFSLLNSHIITIQTLTTGLSTYDFVRMASKTSGLSVRLPEMPDIILSVDVDDVLHNPNRLNIRGLVRKKSNLINSNLYGSCVRDYIDKLLHLVCFCLPYFILFTFSSCCLFKLPLQPPATTRLGTEFALFVRFLK